jgi:uncharacterized damage-inducible protein DinB
MQESLRYPIGTFDLNQTFTVEKRKEWLREISKLPAQLKTVVEGLSSEQLDTPYRPNGWTIRQVIHHLPDSHMNSYIRFKLALTEEQPTIRPYMEDRWAKLDDYKDTPIEVSLSMLSFLHQRWVILLNSLDSRDFSLTFNHPESGLLTLEQAVGLYAWHGRHHLSQITTLLQQKNWYYVR